jgi:hypothetical protein
VPTTLSRYDGMFHGFFNMIGLIDQAQRGVDEACVWVQSLWT